MQIKKYHPQIFLKECKHAVKRKKVMNKINEEVKLDKSEDDKHNNEYIYPFKCYDYIPNCFLIFMDLMVYAVF